MKCEHIKMNLEDEHKLFAEQWELLEWEMKRRKEVLLKRYKERIAFLQSQCKHDILLDTKHIKFVEEKGAWFPLFVCDFCQAKVLGPEGLKVRE